MKKPDWHQVQKGWGAQAQDRQQWQCRAVIGSFLFSTSARCTPPNRIFSVSQIRSQYTDGNVPFLTLLVCFYALLEVSLAT